MNNTCDKDSEERSSHLEWGDGGEGIATVAYKDILFASVVENDESTI